MACCRLVRFFFFTGLLWVVFSCAPCANNLYPPVSKYDFEFTVVDAGTGANMLFGENASLDPSGFQRYSLRGTEPISHPLHAYVPDFGDGHPAIRADISNVAGDLYLVYPDGKTDTLRAFFERRETECWGTIDLLRQITRNGSEIYDNIFEVLLFEY